MVQRTDWFPTRLADQDAMFTNINGKIGGYETVLPITTAQKTEIQLICTEFIAINNYVTASRATTESLVEWRDFVFNGDPVGDPCPEAPAYSVFSVSEDYFIGIFKRFRELVDLIKASPGYTRAIGEDLMIVAVKGDSVLPEDLTPELKVSAADGYVVNIGGSLQGTDAIRIEYKRNGAAAWSIAGFLTKLPGTVTITPNTPGEPEVGNIRGRFVKKNADVGNFSPQYSVTLS